MGDMFVLKVKDLDVWEKINDVKMYETSDGQSFYIRDLTQNGTYDYFKFKADYEKCRDINNVDEIIKLIPNDCVVVGWAYDGQVGVEEYYYYAGCGMKSCNTWYDDSVDGIDFKRSENDCIKSVLSYKKIELNYKESQFLKEFGISMEPSLMKLTKTELVKYAADKGKELDKALSKEEMVLAIDPRNIKAKEKIVKNLQKNPEKAKGTKYKDKKFVFSKLNKTQTIEVEYIVLSEGGIVQANPTKDTNFCIYSFGEGEKTKKMEKVNDMIAKGKAIKKCSVNQFKNL